MCSKWNKLSNMETTMQNGTYQRRLMGNSWWIRRVSRSDYWEGMTNQHSILSRCFFAWDWFVDFPFSCLILSKFPTFPFKMANFSTVVTWKLFLFYKNLPPVITNFPFLHLLLFPQKFFSVIPFHSPWLLLACYSCQADRLASRCNTWSSSDTGSAVTVFLVARKLCRGDTIS